MLLCEDIAFKWTLDCAQAFLHFKHVLSSSLVLRPYSSDAPVEVQTEDSVNGLGAVHSQRNGGAQMKHVTAYASGSLS